VVKGLVVAAHANAGAAGASIWPSKGQCRPRPARPSRRSQRRGRSAKQCESVLPCAFGALGRSVMASMKRLELGAADIPAHRQEPAAREPGACDLVHVSPLALEIALEIPTSRRLTAPDPSTSRQKRPICRTCSDAESSSTWAIRSSAYPGAGGARSAWRARAGPRGSSGTRSCIDEAGRRSSSSFVQPQRLEAQPRPPRERADRHELIRAGGGLAHRGQPAVCPLGRVKRSPCRSLG